MICCLNFSGNIPFFWGRGGALKVKWAQSTCKERMQGRLAEVRTAVGRQCVAGTNRLKRHGRTCLAGGGVGGVGGAPHQRKPFWRGGGGQQWEQNTEGAGLRHSGRNGAADCSVKWDGPVAPQQQLFHRMQ